LIHFNGKAANQTLHRTAIPLRSIAQKITGGNLKMRLTYLNWLEKYMVDLEIKDAKIWKALRSELLPYSHPRLYRLLSSYQSLIKQIEELVIFIWQRTLPFPVRHWLWTKWQGN